MNRLDEILLKINIEKAVQYDFDNHKVFGSAYCVIQENNVIYKKCFGTISADNTETVTENTIFRLASMTKPVTAIATLILVDRGQLSLSDKVSDYLPEYKDVHITQISDTNEKIDLGKAQNDITICHLLTHTSGIGSEAAKLQKMTDEDKKSIWREILSGMFALLYWLVAILFIVFFEKITGSNKWWIVAIVANVIFPLNKKLVSVVGMKLFS